jgi:two-component sensor histidine kinase
MTPTRTGPDLRLALSPDPEAAGRARAALAGAGLSTDVEHTVTLLATELVANAVRHAGMRADQRIVLLAHVADDFARIEVYDGGPGFDADVRNDSSGFGLRLVEKLSTRWGTEVDEGCLVWFELDRRPRFSR